MLAISSSLTKRFSWKTRLAPLPCSVVVQDLPDGRGEVAAIDPVASMQAIDNPQLKEAAAQVSEKLKRVIARLRG